MSATFSHNQISVKKEGKNNKTSGDWSFSPIFSFYVDNHLRSHPTYDSISFSFQRFQQYNCFYP